MIECSMPGDNITGAIYHEPLFTLRVMLLQPYSSAACTERRRLINFVLYISAPHMILLLIQCIGPRRVKRQVGGESYVVMADEGLVQFLVLAKGAKGAACVALIQQVLSHKKIFVFGELLAMPNVQAVRMRDDDLSLRSFRGLPVIETPLQSPCFLEELGGAKVSDTLFSILRQDLFRQPH